MPDYIPDYILNALFILFGLMLLRQLIFFLRRRPHPVPRFLLNALLGLCVLLMANTVGGLFGMGLGLNALTLPAAAALGAPGVALMWALCYLL